MIDILILTGVVLIAALVTALALWPWGKPESHEMDSAEILKALRGKG